MTGPINPLHRITIYQLEALTIYERENMNGLPGIGGSLGACAWCGKPFALEIIMGHSVPIFQIDQVKGDLAAHRNCLELLKGTKSILEWPAESPIRMAIEDHNKKFDESNSKWEPMDTAPKDGTVIIGLYDKEEPEGIPIKWAETRQCMLAGVGGGNGYFGPGWQDVENCLIAKDPIAWKSANLTET